jgi:hypothetical protein
MSDKLKSLFKDKNLQAAADQILTDVDTPQARIALLNQFIAGEVNPTFEQSTAINDWLKKQKKADAPRDVEKSPTVTTPAVAARRPTAGMTW